MPIAVKTLLAALLVSSRAVSGQEPPSGERQPLEPAVARSSAVSETGLEDSQDRSPRVMLELLGLDEPFWNSFVDGRPLEPAEHEHLLRLLYRLQQFGSGVLAQAAQPVPAWSQLAGEPRRYRGEVVAGEGQLQRVTREALSAEEQKRLHYPAWFRCQVVLAGGQQAEVCALAVPGDWKLDVPLNERVAFDGILVKWTSPVSGGAPGEGAGRLVLAAKRLAWYPRNLLGDLRMDFGLFDGVRDRTRLNERDCFYQLLAAVVRAAPGQIEAAGRMQLSALRDDLPALLRDPDLPARQRASARRALQRAERGASDVVPLFNAPADQRGKLFVVRGDALRAIEIRVTDLDIVTRYGFDHYFEVELVTDDSQNHPVVCCVADLPAGMPLGERIHEPVVVSGFFLKSWAYEASSAADDEPVQAAGKRQLLAPMLVARTLHRVAAPDSAGTGLLTSIGLTVLLAMACALVWWFARTDRVALRRARLGGTMLPERIVLEGASNEEQKRQDAE